jgi:GT2 family glycosyltransferase
MALNNTDNNSPLISVIIPAFNRRAELEGLLAFLEKQTLHQNQFEIIVVDDGSTDDTPAFLKAVSRSGKNNFYFYCRQNSGPGSARDHGMLMAHAPFFAFTDTDCRPFPNWLEELLLPFQEKDVGAVGGAEEVHKDDSVLIHAIHFCMTSPFTTGGLRGKQGIKLARYYPRTFNMAISREAFNKTAGFRPLYHGEDVELSFRIKKEGFRVCYNQNARVYHKRRCSIKQFFFQVVNMGKARVSLASLHPELLEILHILPAAGVLIFALLLILSFFISAIFNILIILFITGFIFLAIIGFYAKKKFGCFSLLFLVPAVFTVQQAAYGIGFFWGLYKLIINKESVMSKVL